MTTATYSAISSYSRVQILHTLQKRGQRTITDLREATGLHANTVREHVQRLIDIGYIVAETEHRTTRGRPRVLYSAASGTRTASPIAVRKAREAAERGDLMRRIMPWTDTTDAALPTDAVHQIDALVEDLVDAGFDPAIDESTLTVDISPCPHAEAAPEHRDTLCAVHLMLMDAVLSQAGGPLRVDAMAASCDPRQCVVRLMLAQRDAAAPAPTLAATR
ncbi:winged helix-turn-helix transcriptional regulator [Microbacterium sp. 18062]|uniref:winged helix-turn-helix transcriptional regulator n=1 Tax=Microbacterium sp. 18062 TaxID=2681410 RepID=UPI00135AC989|nr:winged helix-turn-helix transcriptional regulator [Microbacterium sp. 18062]